MKIWVVEWASAVDVPRFDRIHELLNAFLRASEQGAWTFDTTEKNNPFVLHYRRGPRERSLFGWGRKMIPAPFKRVVSLRPMRLIVELAPSLTQVSLTIRQSQGLAEGAGQDGGRGTLFGFGKRAEMDALYRWNGLGQYFGLGQADGKVDHRAVYLSLGVLVLAVILEVGVPQ